MLKEIVCEKFRKKVIEFHGGFNVILGDENATNSIGKSTLLMIVDFVFGGNSLLEHNTDIVRELDHHDYYYSFIFGGEEYKFRRGTLAPDLVYRCNERYESGSPMPVQQFTAFLKNAYEIPYEDISFRAMVGLYLRVWGKSNLDVHKPFHAVPEQAARDCVENLIKTYGYYEPIRSLTSQQDEAENERKALSAALKNNIIPKIGKKERAENEGRIAKIETEIEEIKVSLAKFATNISEVANREVLELKNQKDALLSVKMKLDGKRSRISRNIAENRHVKSRHFDGLIKFFPEVNADRLAEIEEFHVGVAKILKEELLESERDLNSQLSRINQEISSIDAAMANAISSVDVPSIVVDRVCELATTLGAVKQENEYFESEASLKRRATELRNSLSEKRVEILRLIECSINDGIHRVVTSVFGKSRKSPKVSINGNSYSYEVFDDTGTGTAYASLIVLDLTIFSTTKLPILAHDSLLFKNIENDSMANLFGVYLANSKQSFVAVDEAQKYGKETSDMLKERSVVQLSDNSVLYVKDWRTKP
ncbi:DUF2326 domain-containing protein [Methyloversatilis sp.]|uniref:DUF2326 domain-containing protein n=1 Tax=Methyloversatilis sp. TaxID=2569862 RepID=UPI002734FC3B|nr:DUF2326 domain-containing protein [Methyloversatilis sp.]MDP2867996.1 DUF2326 domain-containing protein [Methyloversatilis sp.]MDP3454931.1 DUF2326 domain-containing protein [Methyloversatilis sp.]MDP3577931.1 DUF2326 domain-containing protein [Methyloversatilis sp.]